MSENWYPDWHATVDGKPAQVVRAQFSLMAVPVPAGAQTVQTLCAFNHTNGATPYAALTLGQDGNFYGTTEQGGITNSTYPYGMGTVFRLIK